jgi:hypothetical protein
LTKPVSTRTGGPRTTCRSARSTPARWRIEAHVGHGRRPG